jgi:hypothetical protein
MCFSTISKAQYKPGKYDTILVSAKFYNGDTIPYKILKNTIITGKAPVWLVAYWRNVGANDAYLRTLKYNVNKVYPYAVLATYVLHDIDSVMAGLFSRDSKLIYKERREAQLNARFKAELTDLTITQGQILVKLINRQSGKNVYDIIKQLKGGTSAMFSQGLAKLFDNNLRNNYDPNGVDADVEGFVREIESKGSYQMVKF